MQFKWIFAPKECFSTLIIRQNDFAKSDLRMNARSYQELLNSKQRRHYFFSDNECRLFRIYIIAPFRDTPAFTLPLLCIPLFCLVAALLSLQTPRKYLCKLNLFAGVLGLLWAAHTYVKSQYCLPNNQDFY